MTTETIHTHDLGVTVSIGDIPETEFVEVKRRVRAALIDVVKELGLENVADVMTTYDGRVECGEHR